LKTLQTTRLDELKIKKKAQCRPKRQTPELLLSHWH